MSSYQPGIPTGTVNLDVDYQNIQDNFQQANTSFGIDHVPFSVNTLDNPAGYHTSIHYVPVSTTVTNPPNNNPPVQPTTTPGFGQLWSAQINDGINIDEALFFLTGGNRNLQLTRNFVPTKASNGATFLPGGLIMNWGIATVNISGASTDINFTQPFASNLTVYSITISCINTGGNSPSSNNVYVKSGTVLANKFTVTNSSSGSITQIYWMAIGS